MFPEEVQQYDADLIKEVINNCIAHSDYRRHGKINVEEFEDHLVFINEGAFIPETIEKELEPGYKPPYYRNAFLCNAMVNMYMIDTNSMGIPMIYNIQKARCFPLPTYDLDVINRVSVTIYGKGLDKSYTCLLHSNAYEQRVALRKLIMIDNAGCLEDLKVPPANRLEALSGNRKGQYSIRINDQYRICFAFKENCFYNVEIVDYH